MVADLLKKIARREGIGGLLAEGIKSASEEWGLEDIAVHVKGMEPAGYDPRVLKGMGLAFAVSERGACHLRTTFYKPELAGIIDPATIDGKAELFKDFETISTKLNNAKKVGLGYLQLNQPARTLSGGEAQRLKIVKELSKKSNKKTLYILDEPTIGQHMEDISNLIDVLHLLVNKGHTVVVIEHHSHVLASCDWIIELGPGAGPEGGLIIAKGPPEEVIKLNTPTAPYLKKVLEGEM